VNIQINTVVQQIIYRKRVFFRFPNFLKFSFKQEGARKSAYLRQVK